MDLGLEGRRAVVTGGSRGIGRAVATKLAAEGVRLAICARTQEPLESAAAQIADRTGAEVIPVVADVRDAASVEAFVATAAERLGGLDIVVSSAARVGAGSVPEDLEHVAEETILGDFEEKFLGALRTCRAALPHLRQAGWGRIVTISGLTARVAGQVSAGARNAALVHLTRTMSLELGRDGITVNAIYPAVTVTEGLTERLTARAEREGSSREQLLADLSKKSAIGRLVTADEVADVVVFLASKRSAGITGEAIAVSGGTGVSVSY